jgi:ATP/maltotriose-dependent transcriptional regulator MalT
MLVAERVGASSYHVQAMHTLGLVLNNRGRLAEGLSTIQESFRLAKEVVVGNFGLLHRMYNNVPSSIAEYASDYVRAEEIVREGIEVARKAGARHNLGWQLGTLGDVLFEQGRLPEAELVQQEALEHATAVADVPLICMRTVYLGRIRFTRGDLEEAVALFGRAEDLFQENPEPQTEVLVELFGGQLGAARGDDELAAKRFQRVRDIGSRHADQAVSEASLELARLLLREGPTEAGKAKMEFSGEVSPFAAACATAISGLGTEDPSESISVLRDAAGRFEAMKMRVDLARCLLDLGRAQQRIGEDGRSAFERAHELLVECDAKRYLPEAEELLATASAT